MKFFKILNRSTDFSLDLEVENGVPDACKESSANNIAQQPVSQSVSQSASPGPKDNEIGAPCKSNALVYPTEQSGNCCQVRAGKKTGTVVKGKQKFHSRNCE